MSDVLRAGNCERAGFNFKLEPNTVQSAAVEKLRSAIIEGVFKPGDRLVEASLCSLLGISRPSVREALRSLEAEKLVEIIRNRGPVVRTIQWAEAEAIYDARAVVEAEAVGLFADRAKSQQIVALQAALEAFHVAVRSGDVPEQVRTTGEFYGIIFHGCGNMIIEEILAGLLARISSLRQRSMSRRGRSTQSHREMEAIYKAIAQHDVTAARSAAIEHVMRARAAAKLAFSEYVTGETVALSRKGR